MLDLYEKVRKFIPEVEWAIYEPLVDKINRMKKEKNAVIAVPIFSTELRHI